MLNIEVIVFEVIELENFHRNIWSLFTSKLPRFLLTWS